MGVAAVPGRSSIPATRTFQATRSGADCPDGLSTRISDPVEALRIWCMADIPSGKRVPSGQSADPRGSAAQPPAATTQACGSSRTPAILSVALMGLFPAPGLAQEPSYLERALIEQQPCRDLKTTILGIEMGITRTVELSVDTVTASLTRNELALSGKAGLTCATPESALVTGDVSAVLNVDVAIDVISCEITRSETALGEFGGKFGSLAELLAPSIDKDMNEALVEQCRALDLAGKTDA